MSACSESLPIPSPCLRPSQPFSFREGADLSFPTEISALVTSTQEDPASNLLVQIMDSNFFSAFFAVLGVVVGAWLTHKYSLKSKVSEDNRERLLASVMDALQHADDLLDNFKDFAYNAPRGGGSYRPSGDPEAEWIKISKKEAREHDKNAANAIERMYKNTEMLRKLNVQLSVFSPPELVRSFQEIPEYVTNFLQKSFEEGGLHRGQLATEALEGMQKLFDEALRQTVELAEVKFKKDKKRGSIFKSSNRTGDQLPTPHAEDAPTAEGAEDAPTAEGAEGGQRAESCLDGPSKKMDSQDKQS